MQSVASGLALAALLAMVSSSYASLSIGAGDIVNNGDGTYGYTYDLTYGEMAESNNHFNADVYATDNGAYYQDSTTWSGSDPSRYIRGRRGWNSGWFTYQFDFSALGLTADSITIRDNVRLENNVWDYQQTTARIQWSTDNSNWNTIRTVSSSTDFSGGNYTTVNSTETNTIPLPSGTTTIYYRVFFDALGHNAMQENLNRWNCLWGDAGYDPSNYFKVDVALVPEPMTIGLLATGLVGLLRRRMA
jgi:hypothetical protein